MSTQTRWMAEVGGQRRGDAAGMGRVWRDRASLAGCSGTGRARRVFSCIVAVLLVCLVAMPASAPAAAVPGATLASAPAAPGDEYWAAGYNLPGMNRDVTALAVGPDGSLYAGGCFTTAGGVAANYIARWDGSQWHPLGSGMSWDVQALALGPDGSLYAGGYFSTAGGVAADYIARWDAATSSWHPLGSGMSGAVLALAFGPDGLLYAGSRFSTADGVAANGIARWDAATSSWHPLGSGMTGPYQSSVSALAFGLDSSLYAGGEFDTAGGKPSVCIARWTGVEVRGPAAWFPIALIDQ